MYIYDKKGGNARHRPFMGVSVSFLCKEDIMLDMKFVRENPDIVKENIKKKFQDYKLPLVNEVLMEDKELRQTQQHADDLRANRKKISKEIGKLMGQGKKEEAEEIKQQMAEIAHELTALEEKEIKLRESVTEKNDADSKHH